MSLSVLTKPIGLISKVLMAKYFGAGAQYDAYLISFFLVNFLANTLTRVFTAVAIPYITELRSQESGERIFRLMNAALIMFMAPMVAYPIFLLTRGNLAVRLIVPNAASDTKALATQMLLLMAVPGLITVFIGVINSVLNLNKAHRLPAAMPIINSMTMLLVLIAGHKSWGIWALPIAYSISMVIRGSVGLGYALYRGHFRIARPLAPKGFRRELWSRSWMVLVSSAILAVNHFMDKFFASGLAPGSISSIAYSATLVDFGCQIFQLSLVAVMFTQMSELIAAERMAECGAYIQLNTRKLAKLVVPVSIAISLASFEIVGVLFQRDAFTTEDSVRTASALSMYMLGMPALLINLIAARVFHSLKLLKLKIWLAVQYIGTNVLGNFFLVGPLKVMGLAISSTLAINIHLGLSIFLLYRQNRQLRMREISITMFRHYLLGLVTILLFRLMGLGDFFSSHLVNSGAKWELIIAGTAKGLSVLVIFFLLHLLQKRTFAIRSHKC